MYFLKRSSKILCSKEASAFTTLSIQVKLLLKWRTPQMILKRKFVQYFVLFLEIIEFIIEYLLIDYNYLLIEYNY